MLQTVFTIFLFECNAAMADVFISYTKPERRLTETLAAALKEENLTVWWDTELLPKDGFRAEIDAQLNACSAAVIIWSAQSAVSYWVLSEADHALKQGKLVNAHHTNIRPEDLPKPFGQIHAVPVTDTDAIIKAVRLLQNGAQSTNPTALTEKSALMFVREAMNDALKHAPALLELANRENWEDEEGYPDELLKLAQKVFTPLRLFRERLPYAEINTYPGRILIEELDEATAYAHRQMSKEVSWLQSHRNSKSVVMGARGDLIYATEDLLEKVQLPE